MSKFNTRDYDNYNKGIKVVGQYRIGKVIGTGTFSKVRLGTNIFNNEKCAIKVLKPFEAANWKAVEREIEILRGLQHPNIINLQEVLYIQEGDYGGGEGERELYMILEYAEGGELFDHIVETSKLDEVEARCLFRQMVSALEYMHAHLVVHRDLKPENILLDKSKNIKINDFGLSNFIDPGVPLKTFCGSPIYAAPEIVNKKKYEGTGVDVWSLGIILFTMTTGHMPWKLNENEVENVGDMLKGRFTLPPNVTVSPECMDLMKIMIVSDPKKRATLQEIRMHKWTNIGFDSPPPCMLEVENPVITVNDSIVKKMISMGFHSKEIKAAVQSHEKSPLSTIYHTIEKRGREDYIPNSPQLKKTEYSAESPRVSTSSPGKSPFSRSMEGSPKKSLAMAYLDEEDKRGRSTSLGSGSSRVPDLSLGDSQPTSPRTEKERFGFIKSLFGYKK